MNVCLPFFVFGKRGFERTCEVFAVFLLNASERWAVGRTVMACCDMVI